VTSYISDDRFFFFSFFKSDLILEMRASKEVENLILLQHRYAKIQSPEVKSMRSKFAKGSRVIVESAGRNLSARGQVTGVGLGSRSRVRSWTDLGTHLLLVLERHPISSFAQRCLLIVVVVVAVSFGSLDLRTDLPSHTVLRIFVSYLPFIPSSVALRHRQPTQATMPDAR